MAKAKNKAKKAVLYAYIDNEQGKLRTREPRGWTKLNCELEIDEFIEKLSWRTSEDSINESGGWGSNNIVIRKSDLDTIVGKLLTYCDAMLTDKEQKAAWKQLIRSTIHDWHDNKTYSFNLEDVIDKIQ